MRQNLKMLIIAGPTASGKSALAVKLAKKINGEVISADSRQVYKGLDIGSGKITRREMRGVPHHLLDVISPKKIFTAYDFVIKGRAAIEDILKRGKAPIICGGTGFYIDALVGRVTLPNVAPNPKLRRKLALKTAPQLYTMLKIIDPRRAMHIDRHNSVRLVRAIEIAKTLGHSSMFDFRSRTLTAFEVVWIGIKPDDSVLRTKIHKRLLQRMRQGMVTEAKRLHARGLSYKRMHSLGLEYRFLALLLQNKISKQEMLAQLESSIWDYSRRQLRYWKRNTNIAWLPVHKTTAIVQEAKQFLKGSPNARVSSRP